MTEKKSNSGTTKTGNTGGSNVHKPSDANTGNETVRKGNATTTTTSSGGPRKAK